MNYGDDGDAKHHVKGKTFLADNRRAGMGRNQQGYQKYMDVMSASLNQNMIDNIKPYWRDHQSVKGWSSMNYPTVMQNPLLKRRETKKEKEEQYEQIKFSNLERPITGYQHTKDFHRPFSTKDGGETLMHKRKNMMYKDPSNGKLEVIDEAQLNDKGLPHIQSVDRATTANTYQFGKSLQPAYHQQRIRPDSENVGYSFMKVEDVLGALPPKKLTAKEKKELEEKKKQAEADALELKKQPKFTTKDLALQSAPSWQNSVAINKKNAVGTLASSKYDEKVAVFNQVHADMREKSNIWPMDNYFGKTPDPSKDIFNRRTVKQLEDITFSDDSEDDFEDVRNIKRQRRTILTEENLKQYLCNETVKLNIEHHTWLKDSFLSKLGKMAKNLQELCLRRLPISDGSFSELADSLAHIERLDISDCYLIQEGSVIKFLKNNGATLERFSASSCIDAITDKSVAELASLDIMDHEEEVEVEQESGNKKTEIIYSKRYSKLQFLDISYAKLLTDEGLTAFKDKTFPLTHLCVNGLSMVTGAGLQWPIMAAQHTLVCYHGALMDQEELKVADFGKALGHCFLLESLDLGGCKHITDEFFNHLIAGSKVLEDESTVKPGLQHLQVVKLNGLENIYDSSVTKICQTSAVLEELELTHCKNLSEYGIEGVFKSFKQLQFVDINHIPVVTPAFYEVLLGHRPDLHLRRYKQNEVDPKDNMLRVPLRIISKGKKKKGKKKKKK